MLVHVYLLLPEVVEAVGLTQGTGFQLKQMPGTHLSAGKRGRRILHRIDRGEHGAGQVSGLASEEVALLAVLVETDDTDLVGRLRRNQRCYAAAPDDRFFPVRTGIEQHGFLGVAYFDWEQFFFQNLQLSIYLQRIGLKTDFQPVLKGGSAGCGRLTQVVVSGLRYDHIDLEGHEARSGSGMVAEKAAHIALPAHFAPHTARGFEQWHVGQVAQEADCVEKVGFPDGVGPGDTGKRPEMHLCLMEVFESVDLDACDHVAAW
ncbi:MAG: hypothetical protein OHK0039_05670 [Bacteroidia bacterium]